MRRIGLIILAWAGLMALAPAPSLAAPPQTLAPHAILVEAETGSVLFEKQADDLVAPASLAKLMTVSVVFEQLDANIIKTIVPQGMPQAVMRSSSTSRGKLRISSVSIGASSRRFFARSTLVAKRGSLATSGMPRKSQNLRKAGSFPAATKISQVRVTNFE